MEPLEAACLCKYAEKVCIPPTADVAPCNWAALSVIFRFFRDDECLRVTSLSAGGSILMEMTC